MGGALWGAVVVIVDVVNRHERVSKGVVLLRWRSPSVDDNQCFGFSWRSGLLRCCALSLSLVSLCHWILTLVGVSLLLVAFVCQCSVFSSCGLWLSNGHLGVDSKVIKRIIPYEMTEGFGGFSHRHALVHPPCKEHWKTSIRTQTYYYVSGSLMR